MKNLVLTTIIALGVAAPALAQSQLESSVGAHSGQYTVGELALLADRSTSTGSEARTYLGYNTIHFSTMNVHNATAQAIFDSIARESHDDE